MKYVVEISDRSQTAKADTENRNEKKLLDKIYELSNDPRPFGYKKLYYYTDYFRVRVGNYRIIYTIQDQRLLVVIVEVTDRRDAY